MKVFVWSEGLPQLSLSALLGSPVTDTARKTDKIKNESKIHKIFWYLNFVLINILRQLTLIMTPQVDDQSLLVSNHWGGGKTSALVAIYTFGGLLVFITHTHQHPH